MVEGDLADLTGCELQDIVAVERIHSECKETEMVGAAFTDFGAVLLVGGVIAPYSKKRRTAAV